MISLNEHSNVKNEIIKLNKMTRLFSIIRLIMVFLVIVFMICFLCYNNQLLYSLLCIFLIIGIFLLNHFTNPFYRRLKFNKSLDYIYNRHINRRNNNYRTFSPNGKEFIDYNDYKTLDLDILGPRSIYQYLCVAKSYGGRKKLAELLTKGNKNPKMNDLVVELADSKDSLLLEAAINNLDYNNSIKDQELIDVTTKSPKISKIGLCLMFISIISMILFIVFGIIYKWNLLYVLIFLPINFIISYKFGNNEIFSIDSTKYSLMLEDYINLVDDIKNINIVDDFYKEIKEYLLEDYKNLINLHNIFEMLSYRRNFIFNILGNSLLFFNFICIGLFNRLKKNSRDLTKTINYINDLECALSLSIIGLDNECWCKGNEGPTFNIVEGYHPLIQKCISNDFILKKGVVLTGSNMAGKTTFMRMLGINQILHSAGGIVCATSFTTPFNQVYTSLRIVDELSMGISSFYAEINKMKHIIENANQNSLVLIDEIFKGTNAKDRIYSAKKVIEKLNLMNVLFIITTHDFEICDTENIINYHFMEEYEEEKIKFDYKIKNGRCNKSNALYLLKMAKVIE